MFLVRNVCRVDPLRKLPRVISPAEAKYTATTTIPNNINIKNKNRNTPVDLLNPNERDKFLYQQACHLVSPPTQRAYLGSIRRTHAGSDTGERSESRMSSYEGTKSKPVLARWAHMMSPDPLRSEDWKYPDKKEREQSIIIVSDKEDSTNAKSTRILAPSKKATTQSRRSLSRGGSERLAQINYHGPLENSKSAHNRVDRMPKWRRYTAEFPGSVEKPPTPAPRTMVRDTTVYGSVNDAGRRTTQNFISAIPSGRQKSMDVSDGKQRTIELNSNGNEIGNVKAHLYRKTINGLPTKNGTMIYVDAEPKSKANGVANYETGMSRLVYSAPMNGLDSRNLPAESNGSVVNGINNANHTLQVDSAVNRSPVLNGDHRPGTPFHSSARTEIPAPACVKAWTTTRLKETPAHLQGWDAKNAVTIAGLQRSQSKRGSMEVNKPTALLTSSTVVAPDFTRVYNGNNPTVMSTGRDSRSSDGRHSSDLAAHQANGNKNEYRGIETPRNWPSPTSMSPSPTEHQQSGCAVAPRRQNWAFGVIRQNDKRFSYPESQHGEVGNGGGSTISSEGFRSPI
ncbi:unnamed protein product [Echinostoma caproni]|uniref:Neuron navigator 2 n=1 Tax=Echinostoma caproni TaxID=27848 RepID=A0A182ZZM5_9TREM|nr:unnamed protein product [Echinostoma caproni]